MEEERKKNEHIGKGQRRKEEMEEERKEKEKEWKKENMSIG